MIPEAEKEVTARIISFLTQIGIEIQYRALKEEDCFLPGLMIEAGSILIDAEKLKYPGDIVHEAGHIAVVSAADRPVLQGKEIEGRMDRAAEEMMAIAWSYAACVAMEMDPVIVFHENGYKGGGESIAVNFKEGRYFGVPMLQFYRMCAEPHMAERLNMKAYPQMETWLRQ